MPELRSRSDDCCELCGAPIDFEAPPRTRRAPSVDHIVPLHAGGAELPVLDELRLAHVSCNSQRGARTRWLAPRLAVRPAVELRADVEPRARD
jgi:5-methylcytosine-specific restriction endonuclease McrA